MSTEEEMIDQDEEEGMESMDQEQHHEQEKIKEEGEEEEEEEVQQKMEEGEEEEMTNDEAINIKKEPMSQLEDDKELEEKTTSKDSSYQVSTKQLKTTSRNPISNTSKNLKNGVSSSLSRKNMKTVDCILCGGTQIYPGPRYENHLMNEHGVIFDLEYLIQLSLYKRDKNSLPQISDSLYQEKAEVVDKKDTQVQTSSSKESNKLCSKCKIPLSDDEDSDDLDEDERRLIMDCEDDLNDEDETVDADGSLTCWICPVCPRVYKRFSFFKQHASTAHGMDEQDISGITSVKMTEEEYLRQMDMADKDGPSCDETKQDSNGDKIKRKAIGCKEWAPNSFSSTFTCHFCNEQFRKDYKLKLHLMLHHKNEPAAEMAKAKEELTKSKLDGCIHKCTLCGCKYNSVANFTRHIKDVHNITRAQYTEEYGSSEVVSRMFKCELCDKEVKHTRNIIGAHMKMVHLISWKEYQEIILKIRRGESVGDLPTPELFQCIICGVSVKYKREHLNKKHQITEDVYDELIAKKERGEDISDVLPERELHRCLICDRECLDLKKHLDRSHQITEETYEEMISNGAEKPLAKLRNNLGDSITVSVTSNSSPSSASQHADPTDLQCYFGCDEPFKKDYQLYLHLKLKHRNEDPDQLKRAYESADDEIALTRRSGSVYQCALCPKKFYDNGAFYGHIQTKHDMQWREYKEQFGRCEVESAPFECKICNRVIKYDRNTIHTHLKNVHGINWGIYIDRVRKQRRGEVPDDLPTIDLVECRVCNVQVKYIKDHIKNAHKITEQEYESLFENDETYTTKPSFASTPKAATNNQSVASGSSSANNKSYLQAETNPPKPPKSDIQDKTNKTCSSCTITFASRRNFIEHCTVTHKMKFKTKSGMTIQAPPTPAAPNVGSSKPLPGNRSPSVTIKRKSDAIGGGVGGGKAFTSSNYVAPGTSLLQPKRQRLEVSPNSIDQQQQQQLMNDHEKTLGSHYQTTGVSRWNQCKYQCCFCKKTTQSRSSMTSHIANTHGIPIKEYKERNYPDIEVVTNWFQCRLCSTKTKFVKDCISPHLKMSHSIDIEDYERRFMQPEDWPNHQKPTTGTKQEMRYETPVSPPSRNNSLLIKQQQQQHQQTFEPTVTIEATDSSSNDAEKKKWNKCRFQCKLCELITIDARQMRVHISNIHKMSYDSYVKQYGSAEIVTKKFRCEICTSEMKFCRQNIYAHMKDVHKLTLPEYEAKVGYPPVATDEMLGDDNGPIIVDPSMMDYDNGNNFNNDHFTSKWNKCRYQCQLCQRITSEKPVMRDHIMKSHGMTIEDYEREYGDVEIVTEYFFCRICHAEVKHCHRNISLHLQKVHNLTTSQYESQYASTDKDHVMIEGEPTTEEEYGFGAHFLLDNAGGGGGSNDVQLKTPPREDVLNAKNKFCYPCNKEFNKRQGFIDHCRNFHRMNINIPAEESSPPKTTQSIPAPTTPGGSSALSCDYCGKLFSNRSNRNRHMLLSCEVVKNGTVAPGSSAAVAHSAMAAAAASSESIYQDESPTKKEPQKCQFPDCDTITERSALMKRHIREVHGVTNPNLQMPLSPDKSSEDYDEKKVPPLRVKLSAGGGGGMSTPERQDDQDHENDDEEDEDEYREPVNAEVILREGAEEEEEDDN